MTNQAHHIESADMGTQSDLGKWAREFFVPRMKAKGFTISSGSTRYWRQHGSVYHFFNIHRIKQSELVRVWVYPWAAELAGATEKKDFPKNVAIVAGGYLDQKKIEFPRAHLWRIKTRDDARQAFEEMWQLTETVALPWLEGIRTAEDVLRVAHRGQKQFLADLLAKHRLTANEDAGKAP